MPRSSEHEVVSALARLFRDQIKPLIEPLRQEIEDLRAEIVKLQTEKKRVGGYVSINQICAQFSMSRRTFYRLLADPDCALEGKRPASPSSYALCATGPIWSEWGSLKGGTS